MNNSELEILALAMKNREDGNTFRDAFAEAHPWVYNRVWAEVQAHYAVKKTLEALPQNVKDSKYDGIAKAVRALLVGIIQGKIFSDSDFINGYTEPKFIEDITEYYGLNGLCKIAEKIQTDPTISPLGRSIVIAAHIDVAKTQFETRLTTYINSLEQQTPEYLNLSRAIKIAFLGKDHESTKITEQKIMEYEKNHFNGYSKN